MFAESVDIVMAEMALASIMEGRITTTSISPVVTFNRQIKIIQINVNGYASRVNQLRSFVDGSENCILLLNDTRLKGKTKCSDIPGYRMIRQDKLYDDGAATAGGVAIAVPQKWSCKRIDFKHKSDKVESLMAVIIPLGGKPLKVATSYNKPKHHFPSQFLEEFAQLKYNGKELPGVFAGDLNSSHTAFGSRFTNVYGKSLLQTINNKNLAYFNDGSPTFYGKGDLNVLDLVIGSPDMSRLITSCTTGVSIGSDHFPTITCIELESSASVRKRCNIKEWASSLDENIIDVEVHKSEEVEVALESLEELFVTTRAKCERVVRQRKRNLPPEIMSLIRERKDLMKKRKKEQCDQIRKNLNHQYNSFSY